MLALVMPLSLMTGASWEKCRVRLTESYENLIVISIAGSDNRELAFSADTSMGECLIIGKRNGKRQSRATFVVLERSPQHPAFSIKIAKRIRELIESQSIRPLESGPSGGTHIVLGSEIVGHAIDAPLPRAGGWKLARIVDYSLAQSAYHLVQSHSVWLPTQRQPCGISIVAVEQIGSIGPVHRDINGTNPNGSIRGPFELRELRSGGVPTFPVLWAHNNKRERTLVFEADREGLPRQAKTAEDQTRVDEKVFEVFETASHCHSNLDFGFNGQSTAMQFTQRKTIGGRAWISIQLPTIDQEKALVLWGNTSLGLLMFWWHSSKQHPGRGILTKTTLATLPILDITALTPNQLQTAAEIFDDACQLPLKPLHELHIDDNRKLIDRLFYSEVLGLPDSLLADKGPLDILRTKLSQEPSIRGSKK